MSATDAFSFTQLNAVLLSQCNKMTCPQCGTLSCYVCRQIIRGYDHFGNVSLLFDKMLALIVTTLLHAAPSVQRPRGSEQMPTVGPRRKPTQ